MVTLALASRLSSLSTALVSRARSAGRQRGCSAGNDGTVPGWPERPAPPRPRLFPEQSAACQSARFCSSWSLQSSPSRPRCQLDLPAWEKQREEGKLSSCPRRKQLRGPRESCLSSLGQRGQPLLQSASWLGLSVLPVPPTPSPGSLY